MLLSCRGIIKIFGDRTILRDISLDICDGDRIGLVGRNGAGKTTLANIITGHSDYEQGQITTTRQYLNVGYLRQAKAEPELFLNVLKYETEVYGEFQRLASRLGMNRVQSWSGDRIHNLSGGEKTKLSLAKVWAVQPDLLILDEPTNHMDYEGINCLISQLAAYKGPAIIISHDRYFLDRTVSKIAELDNGTIKLYSCNYSEYRKAKQKERESQMHIYDSQQKEQKEIEANIARLKNWSDKAHRESRQKAAGRMGGKEYYRKKAKKRDQAIKSKINRLEKMRQEGISRPVKELQVNFNLNVREKGGRYLLEAENIGKSFGDLLLFKNSSFYVNRGEKVGILGPNGCGKTTLIKMFLGKEDPDTGRIFMSPSAQVAYVNQELPQGEIDSLQERLKILTPEAKRNILQLLMKLGIPYDRLTVPLGELSRGERMKIAMGMAVMGECDLLIMDEPTNHLDVCSREALEESLIDFPGTMLLISHDRYFLDRVCNHLLVFNHQNIRRVEGNLSDYLSSQPDANANPGLSINGSKEELLLIDTQISRLLGEFSRYKPGEPEYAVLDHEYQKLLERKKEMKQG